MALLSIAHRFKFTDIESRARRDVLRCSPLDLVKHRFLAEQLSVPTSFIVPALEDLVRRRKPLQQKELTNLSREMIARLCKAREVCSRVVENVCQRGMAKASRKQYRKARMACRKCVTSIGMTPGGTFVWIP